MSKINSGQLSLIWFGAAISVAEIEAGAEIGRNWAALVSGHAVGGLILFAAGLIGSRLRLGAMATTSAAFGDFGARFFALLNVVQLVGWIAVMNEQSTEALSELWHGFASPLTHIVLSALVGIWVIVGIFRTTRLATFSLGALAILMAILSFRFQAGGHAAAEGSVSLPFWTAFEISAAMPLSWVPVIADYTRDAGRPVRQCALAAAVYTIASVWMYSLGMILGGETTLSSALVLHGLSLVGIPILIVSTVTTNLLAAHSSGESALVVSRRLNAKAVVALVAAGGAALSIFGIAGHYITFLYFIASVFSPMAAVLIVSHFVVKRPATVWNITAWAVGFATYQLMARYGTAPTPVALVVAAALAVIPRFVSSAKETNTGSSRVSP